MSGNRATRKTCPRRGRSAGWAAAVGAALLTAGLALHPAAAGAQPGAASRPALAGPGPGSSNLIQSGDFSQQGLAPVGATIGLAGAQALSACSGEETMRVLTGASATAYAEVTWTFDTGGSLLTESLAGAPTGAAAASYGKRLNALVRDCRHEPAGHWYYGPGRTLTVPAGEATWYPAFGGDGTAAGGVAVLRSGERVGIVELTGQPSDDPAYIAGLTAAALARLAS
ncbi:hypothetical protein [Actinacidiphila epipremni]|uniref:Serine/threonine protein kinase n=1 Tax=Actinacidiphila epipremni TaxID=2053013 RepID=A0ABX1A2Z2_9ACTN|nr:hypothetical protein [Actinacidiphila epipremni]NJP47963.1 hypothetical protein [Actinacidiphila epipremni]